MGVIELRVPSIGESITEVTLAKWLKKDGDLVRRDEPICEFDSDKATLELPAEFAGRLTHVAKEGDDIKIGDVVARLDTSAADAPAPVAVVEVAKAETVAPVAAPSAANYATGTASPAAAKILREADVVAADVAGTGRDGRITKDDAQKAVATKPAAPITPATPTKPATVLVPTAQFSRNERTEKMTRMRRTIAKRLVSAKNNTAMLTTFNEVDLTEVMALREKYQDRFVKKYGIKLGFMSLFAKACAKVLIEMPEVNARLEGEDSVVYHDYADISIAISTPTGLVVPPVKNVESLGLAEIELAIKALADKARGGKLTLDEMSGGTFTITNGGVFGSMMSTPILNEPQSAILGMHTIQQRAMVVGGEIKIRPMMYLALSYDHRVIDGSSSVTFLVKVKALLEDPITLLMNL